MRLFRRALLAIAALPAMALAQQGETPPLIADRPDQTESPAIVAPGLQIETGFLLSQDGSGVGRVRGLTASESLIRIGILPTFEGRIGFAGWQRASADGATAESGMGDLDLGFKYQFAAGRGAVPAVALVTLVTLPTGTDGFGSERPDPTLRLAFEHELSDRLSLGYNVGSIFTTVSEPDDDRTRRIDILYTAVVGAELAPRVGAFIELFGTFPARTGGAAVHGLDGGLAIKVLSNLQLDLAGGIGLNSAAEDWFVGMGVTVRVPG